MQDIISQNIEELEKEEPPQEDSKLKKIFIFGTGIFLVLLMLSYVFVSYPIGNILSGQLESNLLENNQINLEDFSIVFENGTAEMLRSFYFQEQKVEFSVCLQGYKEEGKKDTYFITSLYLPKTHEQSFSHVSFEPCSQESLIILHTHPYKRCVASQVDIRMLQGTKERNADALMVVMCEQNRFSVYS